MYIIGTVLVAILIIFYIYIYNRFIGSKQNVKESWSDIDVQLKRRHDLIPKLVSIVKEYTKHEKALLEEIAKLRVQALSLGSNNVEEKSDIEKRLEKDIKSIFAWAESYPNLRANENFLRLQQDITETEDQIASARRIYNSNVADYNTLVESFPSNLIAKINNFTLSPFFQKD